MMKLKLLSALMLGGSLVACGGSSGGGGGGGEPPPVDPPEEEVPTQLEIENEPLPLREDFSVEGGVEAFFSVDYKALNTPARNTLLNDNDEEYELIDEHPSFYYPTCCVWEEDEESGLYTGNLDPEVEGRWKVGGGKLAMADSARMSIGQVLSDLTDDEKAERKSDTTDGVEGADAESGSWGELDLSQPYRVSFCINDAGVAGTGFSNLELFVDNNSGGRQDESIFTTASMLLREETTSFKEVAGNRLVVEVPGDAYIQDASGNQVGDTLAVNEALDGAERPTGTETSFLQLRVSSGGYVVMSDLVVEHQADDPVEYAACEPDGDYFVPPKLDGQQFAGLPLTVNLDLTKEQFLGAEGDQFISLSDDSSKPFYVIKAGDDNTVIEDGTIRFGNARFTLGDIGVGTEEGKEPEGDIDLSKPYVVSFDVAALPRDENGDVITGGNFQVQVDNNTTSGASSIHGNDSRILNMTIGELQTMIDEQGSNTIVIESDVGTASSLLHIRCDSGCGEPETSETGGITLENIQVRYQDGGTDEGGAFINETFEGIDSDTFFSATHRNISTDASTSFYTGTGGTNLIEDGVMKMDNSRFTAGDRTGAVTTETTTEPQGDIDLSQPYRIQFEVVANDPDPEDSSVAFFVYLDNNTTSSGNSLHDFDSRIVNVDTNELVVGETYTYEFTEEKLGTENSFLQFRCESGCVVSIDNLIVEPI